MTTFQPIAARLARRAQGRKPSPIRAIFPYLSIPGMISFGGGYPNPVTFPFQRMDLFFQGGKWLTLEGAKMNPALQYGPSDSDPTLLEHLLRWHKTKDGIQLSKESLVVLNGAQEGLFIAAYLFLEQEDSVVVSEPTYPGALSAFSPFSQNFVPIPLDDKGMDTQVLAEKLKEMKRSGKKMPKFIYNIPCGHNPGGVALSPERRAHLLEIAGDFDILILEDDPYQLVQLEEGASRETLQSLDPDGRVIRLDSFSKIFAPGLRIGYASGSPEIIHHFVLFKQSANLLTSALVQHILASYLEIYGAEGFLAEIKEKCRYYRSNRNTMIKAAGDFLPADVHFNTPTEGLFIWFRMPDYCNASHMVEAYSKELKVLMVPGPAFSSTGGCVNCMRASFSMVDKTRIVEGMKRFAEMIHREKERA
ncbi:MAG: PLP-dependent aminotransferase family protein [Planctomycetes bacterium]|nr:PLP-dependent aminotransferase family protein [Planctomycetota bacterium]